MAAIIHLEAIVPVVPAWITHETCIEQYSLGVAWYRCSENERIPGPLTERHLLDNLKWMSEKNLFNGAYKDGMNMKKICKTCKEERDAETDFSWEHKSRGIRQTRCKYCQRKLSINHYQNNKQIYNERSYLNKVQRMTENASRIASYLSTHPCVDCGQTNIRVLEFDHVNGQKVYGIADLLTWGFTWSAIEAEIAKCEVRCANCHRIKTIEHGKGWRSTQPAKQLRKSHQMVRDYLQGHPCVDCGYSDIRALEFDHVSGQKFDEISHLLSQGYGWTVILTEIAKCEVRCANCHRIKTVERGGWWRGLIEQSDS